MARHNTMAVKTRYNHPILRRQGNLEVKRTEFFSVFFFFSFRCKCFLRKVFKYIGLYTFFPPVFGCPAFVEGHATDLAHVSCAYVSVSKTSLA